MKKKSPAFPKFAVETFKMCLHATFLISHIDHALIDKVDFVKLKTNKHIKTITSQKRWFNLYLNVRTHMICGYLTVPMWTSMWLKQHTPVKTSEMYW